MRSNRDETSSGIVRITVNTMVIAFRSALLFRQTLAGFLLFGCLTSLTGAQEERRAPIRVAIALEEPVRQLLQLSGSVTAASNAALSTATSGLVRQLRVDVGSEVAEGDELLVLDEELARYQLQSDQAAAAQARQALQDARRRLAEARRLAPQKTIAETAVRDLESESLEDEAALQRAMAVAGRSEGILQRHVLRAPFAGLISERAIDVGEWVTPGQTVFQLVSLEQLYIDFQVSESYLGRISRSAEASISFAGNSSQRYPAEVAVVVPVSNPGSRTFLLRLIAKETPENMRPGTSAQAELAIDVGYSAVSVPRDAVLRYNDGRSVVWAIEDRDGQPFADERFVQTGQSFRGKVEVVSGLKSGERVVIQGNESLRDSQPVRIID
ncbi:MAG: efflux RND transporter periplasmic adaptor subunit [Pseudomonadota bacterium]